MEVPRQSVVESSAAASRIRILQQGRHRGTAAGAEAERASENQVSVRGSLSRPESSQITRQGSSRTPEECKFPISHIK